MKSRKFMIFIEKWSVGNRFGNVFRGIRRPGACVRSWKLLPVTRNALHATPEDWQRCVCAHIIIRNQRKSMKTHGNQWKSMKIQWKSMKILDLEVEQAATTVSLGRESAAWWPNTMPSKPTVSQDHVRTVQQAGGTPTAAPGGTQGPCKKKHTLNDHLKKTKLYTSNAG